MPCIVNGVTLVCSDCGNADAFSITKSDSRETHFTCMKCNKSDSVRH